LITATIVLYKNNLEILKKTVDCFLELNKPKKLFLVDNSPTNRLQKYFLHHDIEYVFVGKNLGFGSAHNKVIPSLKNNSDYHLVLNPDVVFNPQVILNLIDALKASSAAMIAPSIFYPNGDFQSSVRRFPSPIELIARRTPLLKDLFKSKIKKGMYLDKDLTKPFYAEYVSGCFQLYITKSFINIKGFDERYFMYLEDIDICKKLISMNQSILYYPNEKIIHSFEKGSAKKVKLFLYHLRSMFQYFLKWDIR
jgi:GT2 family glycosyltransferase